MDGHPQVGFVGVGEVGGGYAVSLIRGGLPSDHLRVLYLANREGSNVERARVRVLSLGLVLTSDPGEFAHGLDLIVSAVAPAGAVQTALSLGPELALEQTYLDVNSVAPKTKMAIAEALPGGVEQLVDGAIMGAPASSGIISIALSGRRAGAVKALLGKYGAATEVVGDVVGMAATIKMARSVVMKGFAMLLIEALTAARRAGVEEQVLGGLSQALHEREFGELVRRLVAGSLQHAGRRVGEMEEVEAFLVELGVECGMTRATRERLSDLAQMGGSWQGMAKETLQVSLAALDEWRAMEQPPVAR